VSDRYKRGFEEFSVYANVVELARRHRRLDGKVVLDLGCGFGAIAQPITALGLHYIGLDSDRRGLDDLREHGFEANELDLSNPSMLGAQLEAVLDGRTLAVLTMLDVLEHLTNGPEVLDALHALSLAKGRAPLVLSVPNATHIDVVSKMLIGRFDQTSTGLLDRTHVALYSPAHLNEVLNREGWVEVARNDYELSRSDQHFPSDLAVLAKGTPIHKLLHQIRARAGEGAIVNQFVRAYIPSEPFEREDLTADRDQTPFLSVLVRTQGERNVTIVETLLSLAAQTVQDFEVLVIAHDTVAEKIRELEDLVKWFDQDFAERVRVIRADGGGRAHPLNVAIQAAKGSYIAALDDDDIAFANWVEEFRRSAVENTGLIVRTIVAEQDIKSVMWGDEAGYTTVSAPRITFGLQFDFWEHLFENQSPFCGFAFPRSCFTEMGVHFDESLPVVEDWDVIVQTASLCGVTDSRAVTSLYRRWLSPHSSLQRHRADEWHRARDRVLAKIDEGPLLLPPGTLSDYHRLHDELKVRYDELKVQRKMVDHLVYERNAARKESGERAKEIEELSKELHTTRIGRILAVDQSERTQAALAGIHESLSWKFTSPLRSLKAVLGRTRHRSSSP
jgi:glycosyltransferase involved in cell wall biosynthesis/2-polyprenyl-3-methyl-5-hydroxy-6-metoxy-1,4-benzoquinol methylase